MIVEGTQFRIRVFGWYCQARVRGLRANGLRLGYANSRVDAIIVDALLMLYEGEGVEVIGFTG